MKTIKILKELMEEMEAVIDQLLLLLKAPVI
ncbi:MAG: hypothetical protein US19_C0001G0065 [Candidatus Daviesbacteria bacterium GW2011_GWB1_36_5]|uniref:Uncharacterized protein n=1 Tax=Candidatus Daviesbacteria bacterium GW2011_GWB1_36_5 TaxID=1618426 RepID=A0A0G0EZ09_9BACT|nr:MAG: hypothetical protein US19_C0001G0065 [Candidatus Daviesbacteria bacterium GW2011_GWB1_36_5]